MIKLKKSEKRVLIFFMSFNIFYRCANCDLQLRFTMITGKKNFLSYHNFLFSKNSKRKVQYFVLIICECLLSILFFRFFVYHLLSFQFLPGISKNSVYCLTCTQRYFLLFFFCIRNIYQ